MKKFFGYIRQFIQEELDWKYLLFLVTFLSAGIYLWYGYGLKTIRDDLGQKPISILFYYVLYTIPYVTAFGAFIVFRKRYDLLTNVKFWLLTFFAIGIFTLRSTSGIFIMPFLDYFQANVTHPLYWFRILSDGVRYMCIMIPVTVYWYFDQKSSESPYGFTLKNFNLKPYFGMLLIMLPFVIGFGLTDHFGSSYPRVGQWGLQYFDIAIPTDRKYFLFYEFIYGVDFVSIEYFFRGFLIIAFIKYVGPGAILPMASFYVFIHFGKPYVETISSFFGGTLLGILTYYSRSIWGGIVVHVGIAWLMEIGAFIGKLKS